MRIEGVILAAGLSERTAPECKLGFMLAGQSVLERSVGSMLPFCDRVIVVTGAHKKIAEDALRGQKGIIFTHNTDFASGMYGSVKNGLRKTDADAVFVLPGDCPFVQPEVYSALLNARGDIAVPVRQGQAGHPVLLRRPAVSGLLQDETCESLRQFITSRRHERVAVDCPGILMDIDTNDAYQQALLQMIGGE